MRDLSNSFQRYSRAVRKLDEAEEACGYDVEYFTHREREEVKKAEKIFLEDLRLALEESKT